MKLRYLILTLGLVACGPATETPDAESAAAENELTAFPDFDGLAKDALPASAANAEVEFLHGYDARISFYANDGEIRKALKGKYATARSNERPGLWFTTESSSPGWTKVNGYPTKAEKNGYAKYYYSHMTTQYANHGHGWDKHVIEMRLTHPEHLEAFHVMFLELTLGNGKVVDVPIQVRFKNHAN